MKGGQTASGSAGGSEVTQDPAGTNRRVTEATLKSKQSRESNLRVTSGCRETVTGPSEGSVRTDPVCGGGEVTEGTQRKLRSCWADWPVCVEEADVPVEASEGLGWTELGSAGATESVFNIQMETDSAEILFFTCFTLNFVLMIKP